MSPPHEKNGCFTAGLSSNTPPHMHANWILAGTAHQSLACRSTAHAINCLLHSNMTMTIMLLDMVMPAMLTH